MGCPCVILEGAHFLTREHGAAINALLKTLILPDSVKVCLNTSANFLLLTSCPLEATFKQAMRVRLFCSL